MYKRNNNEASFFGFMPYSGKHASNFMVKKIVKKNNSSFYLLHKNSKTYV